MTDEEFANALLQTFKQEAEELLFEWETVCLDLAEDVTEERLNTLFRVAHTLKGSSKVSGMIEFGNFVHKVEDLIKEVQQGKRSGDIVFTRQLIDSQGLLLDWIQNDSPANDEQIHAILYAEANSSANGIEEKSPKLEIPTTEPSEKTLVADKSAEAESPSDQKVASPKPSPDKITEPEKKVAPAKRSKNAKSSNEVLRVKREKIDDIIKSVGELGTQLSVVYHYFQTNNSKKEVAGEALQYCLKYAKELQNLSLTLSLQPLERFFQRLERACRDVSHTSGKKLRILKAGEQIELDKVVLDKIADSFVHIVRNAVDHGIESPEKRVQAGKSETGTIKLSAEQDADKVTIKIADDGAGIDEEAVFAKAVEKGLVTESDRLSKHEINQLILEPGFSTKKQVTEISGRGVGMDVVNTTLNNLGGRLIIQSNKGEGTEFVIQLPTNFSLVESILAKIDDMRYGIPLKDFSEVIDLGECEIHQNELGERFFELRGEIISLHRIDSFLTCGRSDQRSKSVRAAVVNRSAKKPMAFLVDEILGKQNLFVKPLKKGLEDLLGVSGTTIMPDGKAGLVLNLSEIVYESQKDFQGVSNG